MDSIKFFNGYDKVNHLENQNARPKKPASTAITLSAIILFTLVIGLTFAAFVLRPIHGKHPTDSASSASNSVDSIKSIMCNVTRYPDSCFTALSSLNASTKPDPEAFLDLSLQVAIAHLSNLSSSFKSLDDLHPQPALKDCLTLFDEALSRLNDSVSLMKGAPLTEKKMGDLQTWISGAMTDQDTCNDGLDETGWTAPDDEVKAQAQRFKESISNSLAIVANMQNLLQKFGLTMH